MYKIWYVGGYSLQKFESVAIPFVESLIGYLGICRSQMLDIGELYTLYSSEKQWVINS